MSYLLGIDIGTSGTKSVVMDESGTIQGFALYEYDIDTPNPGWAEQNPLVWWQGTVETIRRALANAHIDSQDIAGIGFSGQMHGTVFLDPSFNVIRPAIIWADQRSAPQCRKIYKEVGQDLLARLTANPIAPGFMAATLLWIKAHQPETFETLHKIVLPKDYVRFRLCGEIATDVSDAAGTLLFDVPRRCWSAELLDRLGIPKDLLPNVNESTDIMGQVSKPAAAETGLAAGTPVVAGGADQPVAALGNGVIKEGLVLSTIGTGGQLFTPIKRPRFDPKLRTHTFCHVLPDEWYVMGATLCAGLSLKWFRDNIGPAPYDQLSAEAQEVSLGSEGLLFLPYLVGERTPHMDPTARGVFFGLTLRHGRGHLVRAILEGVVLSMRDSLEIFKELGLRIDRIIASGGGAKNHLWRQIQADVFGTEVMTTSIREQAGVGAAMLAGIGTGLFNGPGEACDQIISYHRTTHPIAENCERYNDLYEIFKGLYPKMKEDFGKIAQKFP
jgi:xylulokinase